jgi:hypothetical protein
VEHARGCPGCPVRPQGGRGALAEPLVKRRVRSACSAGARSLLRGALRARPAPRQRRVRRTVRSGPSQRAARARRLMAPRVPLPDGASSESTTVRSFRQAERLVRHHPHFDFPVTGEPSWLLGFQPSLPLPSWPGLASAVLPDQTQSVTLRTRARSLPASCGPTEPVPVASNPVPRRGPFLGDGAVRTNCWSTGYRPFNASTERAQRR